MLHAKVVRNYQLTQLESGFRKAQSELSQVVTTMNANGEVFYPISSDACTESIDQFYKYFKVIKKNIKRNDAKPNYKGYIGDTEPYFAIICNSGFQIANGMTIFLSNWTGGDMTGLWYVNVDTNGHLKGPNRWGFDLFTFAISPKYKILKVADKNYRSDTFFELGDGGASRLRCTKNQTVEFRYSGGSCAYWASINKSQDNETKTYWENLPK